MREAPLPRYLLRWLSPLALLLLWELLGRSGLVNPGDPAAAERALASIDPSLFRAAQSMGANRWEIATTIVLPGSLPQIFTGLRLAWGLALIVITAAEMVGASSGIGYTWCSMRNRPSAAERVFAGIIVTGLFGFLTDLGFRGLRRWLLPWQG